MNASNAMQPTAAIAKTLMVQPPEPDGEVTPPSHEPRRPAPTNSKLGGIGTHRRGALLLGRMPALLRRGYDWSPDAVATPVTAAATAA